ncbi:MAG: hypothetical protein KAI66_26075, partial [Lentisphaeria bacterium]|nr:hypothetical protein [Lentisphaeria bacterium]
MCGQCGHEFRRTVRVAPRHSGPGVESRGKFVQRDVVSRRRLVGRDQAVHHAEMSPLAEPDKIAPEREERENEEVVSDDGRKKVIRRRKR